jgi:hypothetical protein
MGEVESVVVVVVEVGSAGQLALALALAPGSNEISQLRAGDSWTVWLAGREWWICPGFFR